MRPILTLFLLATACDTAPAPTWNADARRVVLSRCASCHQDGDIAPFPLTTYEEVVRFAAPVRASIEAGAMPPWQAADGCNDYDDNFDLTADERALLLDWLDAGTPEGEPVTEEPPTVTEDPFRVDLELMLPEAYTPAGEPDDYRCQLIELPFEETTFLTGLRVAPDQRALVHHTIVFGVGPDDVETYRALDEADDGPGYTCFGGPMGTGSVDGGMPADPDEPGPLAGASGEAGGSTTWLGSWVPGAKRGPFPEGTGLRLEPGTMLVVQMHYNTLSAAPVADQSSLELMLSSEVEREAYLMPLTDVAWPTGLAMLGDPMTIPAGEPSVTHSTIAEPGGLLMSNLRRRLGAEPDEILELHNAGLHMHQLGRSGSIGVVRPSGDEDCVLRIDEWDFSWQGSGSLREPMELGPDDGLSLSCTWDNSAENQPLIDGEAQSPRDIEWGEGTTDEMCLAVVYMTVQ